MSDARSSWRSKNARKLVLAASLAVGLQAGPIRAETVAEQLPPFTPLRYNEDYSYLRDPALRSGAWWERLKYLPFDSQGWAWLSIGDEIRFRYERYWANNFGSPPRPDEGYLRYRQLPYAGVHLGSNLTVFGQMQIAYGTRDRAAKNPFIDETGFDIVQGFVEWRSFGGAELQ